MVDAAASEVTEPADAPPEPALAPTPPSSDPSEPAPASPAAPLPAAPRTRRPLGALARWQARILARRPGARFGLALAVAIAGTFLVIGVAARLTGDGLDADWPVGAARLAAWLAAGPVALSIANGNALAQRLDGRELVALGHGASARRLLAARSLGAALLVALSIALPAIVAGLTSLACAEAVHEVGERALATVATLPFALVAGAVLGPLAVACDRATLTRGRSWLFGLVVLPFFVADAAGYAHFTIPGALEAVLDLGLWVMGQGRLA